VSALDWSSFDAALLTENVAARERPEGLHHPGNCGPCDDCREWLQPMPHLEGASTPTRGQLLRHAEKFGWECVRETAREYGIDLRVKATPRGRPKRQRRTNDALRRQFAELYFERQLVLGAVADALNISDRRASELRHALEAEGWHRGDVVTAGNFPKPQKIPSADAGLRSGKVAG